MRAVTKCEPGGSIECPLHQGRFDLRSGRALCAPLTQDLVLHRAWLDGGHLLVRLNAASTDSR